MRKYVGYTHVSQDGPSFGPAVHEAIAYWVNKGNHVDIMYAQSTEPSGQVIFSALVTAWGAAGTEVTAA